MTAKRKEKGICGDGICDLAHSNNSGHLSWSELEVVG